MSGEGVVQGAADGRAPLAALRLAFAGTPEFARVAEAYGIPGRTITRPDEMETGAAWLWADPSAPALLDVRVDTFANAYPKIAFGQPITGMEPEYQPLEMEGT